MGNKNSHSNFESSSETETREIEVDDDVNTKEEYYLLTSVEDVDRQHGHQFFKINVFGNNFSVPIEEKLIQGGCKILDVGCGPGTWLLVLESKYKKNSFFGVDIEPVYPSEIKPANVEFIQGDILNGLPFPDNSFDLVNQGSMALILKIDQWDFVLSELVRVTKPGGYIQLCEGHISENNIGPILCKLKEGFLISSLERNVDLRTGEFLKTKFESQQNIIKVNRVKRRVIMGPSGGKIGILSQDLFMHAFSADKTASALSPYLGISSEEYKNMIKDLSEEFKKTKPEYALVRYWAQKN